MNNFSIKEVINYGFTQTGRNWRFFLPATAIIMAVVAGFLVLGALMNKTFLTQLNALQLSVQQQEIALQTTATSNLNQTTLSAEERRAVEARQIESRVSLARFFSDGLKALVGQHWPMLLLTFVLGLLLCALIFIGAIRLSLNFHDEGRQSFWDLASGFRLLPRLMAVVALFSCVTTAALVLIVLVMVVIMLLLHGTADLTSVQVLSTYSPLFAVGLSFFGLLFIYFSLRLRFVWLALVDNHSAMNAFSHSWQITKGNVLRLMLLQILVMIFWFPKLFRVPIFLFPIDLLLVRTYRHLAGKV